MSKHSSSSLLVRHTESALCVQIYVPSTTRRQLSDVPRHTALSHLISYSLPSDLILRLEYVCIALPLPLLAVWL